MKLFLTVQQRSRGALAAAARFLALGAVAGRSLAAEPEVTPEQLPRIPPTEPTAALSTFKVKPGFRIELAASEPEVVSPVAIAFDEDARLFAVEMRDYSERRPERLGRVRLLEDTDDDGHYEKSTVFAGDLPWPTAIACWAGGVFVGATPDILYFKDTDGDGVADVREVIFTGFASEYAPFATNKLNVQALMNSFHWTLENRIHGAASFSGGKVSLADTPFVRSWLQRAGLRPYIVFRDPKLVDLRGRDFSFDPRTLDFRTESGGGQHGMSFDDGGRKFVCSNSDHIQQVVYDDRYARNPWFSMPGPRVSIAADGPAAEVYRLSPDEPWRVIRTAWRVSGQARGPIEGGGRASGYFTGATGITLYRGDAFGEGYIGDAFIGDAGGNLVHRKKLRGDAVVMRAERPADEQKVEFLASTDNWFRPVQFATGPDGCLYVVDMYREVIEHPWSLPANLKKHLDLDSGNDRGRIWRIAPQGFRRTAAPRLGRFSARALAPELAHPNGWRRDTVSRLLYERQDKIVGHTLTNLLGGRGSEAATSRERDLGAVHALQVLDGLDLLEESHLRLAWSRGGPVVWNRALDLAGRFLTRSNSHLLPDLRTLAATRLPGLDDVQLAFVLGRLRAPEKHDLLIDFLRTRCVAANLKGAAAEAQTRDLSFLVGAVVNGLNEDAVPFLEQLIASERRRPHVTPRKGTPIDFMVARLVGARNRSGEISALIGLLSRMEIEAKAETLTGLAEGMQRNGSSVDRLREMLHGEADFDGIVAIATNQASSRIAADLQRAAVRCMAFAPEEEAREPLLLLISGNYPPAVRSVALSALASHSSTAFAHDVFAHWSKLSRLLRTEAIDTLIKRPDRTLVLLDNLENKVLPATELSASHKAALRAHRVAAIRERADKVLATPASGSRASVMDAFNPALRLEGVANRGREHFVARCASCHKLGKEGHPLGPDLATMRNGGKEKLLIAILDPNREVAPNFASYSIETQDGEGLTGVLAAETDSSVTLRLAGGTETTLLRSNIISMQTQGRSLMPEGLEEGLTPQAMADLMAFILEP